MKEHGADYALQVCIPMQSIELSGIQEQQEQLKKLLAGSGLDWLGDIVEITMIDRSMTPEEQAMQEYLDQDLEVAWLRVADDNPTRFSGRPAIGLRTVRDMLVTGSRKIPDSKRLYKTRLEAIMEDIPFGGIVWKKQPGMRDIVRYSAGRLDKVTAQAIDAGRDDITVGDILAMTTQEMQRIYSPSSEFAFADASRLDDSCIFERAGPNRPTLIARRAQTFATDFYGALRSLE